MTMMMKETIWMMMTRNKNVRMNVISSNRFSRIVALCPLKEAVHESCLVKLSSYIIKQRHGFLIVRLKLSRE